MVEYNEDGSLICNLCGREPCRCGVPVHFVKAYDTLTTALLAVPPGGYEGAAQCASTQVDAEGFMGLADLRRALAVGESDEA